MSPSTAGKARWGERRAAEVSQQVAQFLRGLELHPELRRQLRASGYTDQDHRALAACVALVHAAPAETTAVATRPDDGPSPAGRWFGTARALAGWSTEQLRLAAGAVGKLPAAAREFGALATRGEDDPERILEETVTFVRALIADEHFGHFLTLGGLSQATSELRQRLAERGVPEARAQRQQTHAELGFLYARWRQIALGLFADDPTALNALGLR